MKTTLYYFTGTGNSLHIAKQIAQHQNAQLIPIAQAIHAPNITPPTSHFGLIFPVQNHLIPHIVAQFAQKLTNVQSKYCFAICTYGDSPSIALPYLDKLLQQNQAHLSAGFAIHMPYNYINPDGIKGIFKPLILRQIPAEEINHLLQQADAQLQHILPIIAQSQSTPLPQEYQTTEAIVDLLNLRNTLQKNFWLSAAGVKTKSKRSFLDSIALMDAGFSADQSCTQCGTCAAICPTHNIQITSSGPQWQQKCEQCFACLQWCPTQAIQFGPGTQGKQRYHHPSITLSEMRTQP